MPFVFQHMFNASYKVSHWASLAQFSHNAASDQNKIAQHVAHQMNLKTALDSGLPCVLFHVIPHLKSQSHWIWLARNIFYINCIKLGLLVTEVWIFLYHICFSLSMETATNPQKKMRYKRPREEPKLQCAVMCQLRELL